MAKATSVDASAAFVGWYSVPIDPQPVKAHTKYIASYTNNNGFGENRHQRWPVVSAGGFLKAHFARYNIWAGHRPTTHGYWNYFADAVFERACVPQCSGKNCGSDGCGGVCGDCDDGAKCGTNGVCAAAAPTACEKAECHPAAGCVVQGDREVCGSCPEDMVVWTL